MDREKFIAEQTHAVDSKFSLTSGEDDARARFLRLAIDTYDFLASQGAAGVLSFDFAPWTTDNVLRGAGSWTRDRPRIELSPDLKGRWENWTPEYFEVCARNPRLELREALHAISESHDASSWPAHYERRISDWVDAGDPAAPPPFDDRYDIVTPEFFNRLRELRQRCGGWLYWDDTVHKVVFAAEPEWQRVRAQQEAADAEQRRAWKTAQERHERLAKRLPQVIAAARGDAGFWEALRNWELEREKRRPSKIAPDPLGGPIRIEAERLIAKEKTPPENRPLDPIFAEFIARVREPDDVLTVDVIVLNLRAEVRRELDLDHVIGWPGGPGLGEA